MLDSSGLGEEPVKGYCEHGNALLGFMQCWKYPDLRLVASHAGLRSMELVKRIKLCRTTPRFRKRCLGTSTTMKMIQS